MTIIRTSTDADGPALADLDASWPVALRVAPPAPATESFFGPRRRPDDVLVAEVDGQLAGFLQLGRHMSIPSNDHVLHVQGLLVSAHAQGRGVGATLLEAGIAEARRRGVRKLGLRALSINGTAVRLYERHGFVEEGRLRDELSRPDGTFTDDIWMALWLTPPPTAG